MLSLLERRREDRKKERYARFVKTKKKKKKIQIKKDDNLLNVCCAFIYRLTKGFKEQTRKD